jgi:hypothetical protein
MCKNSDFYKMYRFLEISKCELLQKRIRKKKRTKKKKKRKIPDGPWPN